MGPRAYWKGFLRLSLVSCPIQLFPATSEREKISFNQINRETGNRIRYRKVDEDTGEEVRPDEIVKGYQVDKGRYVEISDEEVEAIAIESTRTIEIDEFVPDPVVQRTSSGSAAVHLHQMYRGIPVFQMTRTVRFSPQSEVVDAAGDNAPLPPGIEIEPKLDAVQAVRKAAEHLARTGSNQASVDRFGQTHRTPTIDITGFEPRVLSAIPLPGRPVILEKGPFENGDDGLGRVNCQRTEPGALPPREHDRLHRQPAMLSWALTAHEPPELAVGHANFSRAAARCRTPHEI